MNKTEYAYDLIMQPMKNKYYIFNYFEYFIPRKGFCFTRTWYDGNSFGFRKIPWTNVYKNS